MERHAITVRGIVQGVGFRPFVHALASRLRLRGFVRNHAGTVYMEVEGEPKSLKRFHDELSTRPPPLAKIATLTRELLAPRGDVRFRIETSQVGVPGPIFISPDVATCSDCFRELFDPNDRRHNYPFLNCTNCGPRLTIIEEAPYDRLRTTMARFPMCDRCRAEYDTPTDRRFHAQPVACPECGPQLQLLDGRGRSVETADPLVAFAQSLRAGEIGALKGLGGFHLTCDAGNDRAVRELRRRKHRDEKPLAVMVRDVSAADTFCEVGLLERELLESSQRPIVLLRKRPVRDGFGLADAVAPGNPFLGVMLPYTPLHHLLLRATDCVLVMTSGNRTDEPIAYRDEDVHERLAGIVDRILTHDRPIRVRCDDSVVRVVAEAELPVRRSRGYAPRPISLPFPCPGPILATGGQLKGTFALGRGDQAILSHHLGDLDHYEAYRAFEADIQLYEQLFNVRPKWIAHDRHPDYASTRYAARRARPLIAVQHHHAHMASCMAEHGLSGSVIGVIFDGTGYGTDGAVWGGEFLTGGYSEFHRAAHLRYVGLPGGEQAIREPWRMAAAHLIDAGCNLDAVPSLRGVAPTALRTVQTMLQRQINTPPTSSMGRLFDAVAAICGLRDRIRYEGQAAMELEWLAAEAAPQNSYPWTASPMPSGIRTQSAVTATFPIDTRLLIRAVVEDVRRGIDRATIARRFHDTIVDIIVNVCGRIRARTGLDRVVLSGGVFLNVLLCEAAASRLTDARFEVFHHQQVPPNDGGLSLGQLAVAAATLGAERDGAASTEMWAQAGRALLQDHGFIAEDPLSISQSAVEGTL